MLEGVYMKNKVNEKELKDVITNLSESIDMSDLELYQMELKDKVSIIQLFFDHYFRKYEGMPFSHDKSVYVSKKIDEYLTTGENDYLRETFRDYMLKGNKVGQFTNLDEICYWCPKTILTSEEATAIFFHYLCMDTSYFEKRKSEGELIC